MGALRDVEYSTTDLVDGTDELWHKAVAMLVCDQDSTETLEAFRAVYRRLVRLLDALEYDLAGKEVGND